MRQAQEGFIPIRRRPMAHILGALTLALGLGVVSAGCGAAELTGAAHPAGVATLLASVTVLSDVAMANQNGTGLRSPAIAGGEPGHPTVTLWDEMKPMPQLSPMANGPTPPTIGGGK